MATALKTTGMPKREKGPKVENVQGVQRLRFRGGGSGLPGGDHPTGFGRSEEDTGRRTRTGTSGALDQTGSELRYASSVMPREDQQTGSCWDLQPANACRSVVVARRFWTGVGARLLSVVSAIRIEAIITYLQRWAWMRCPGRIRH
ncbi:hypothetical protein NDU88_000807 [Pleurodeles waltl]|uniref:Uncharacterized protein n=1 Tax=Pleurodeles waltl TaxID=8319 RepID=A0AAV7P626_PLEWA|nr:hypothetical protein NDU88_000807 [Pleurodeles waltl]